MHPSKSTADVFITESLRFENAKREPAEGKFLAHIMRIDKSVKPALSGPDIVDKLKELNVPKR